MPDTKLNYFQITVGNNQSTTNALYANGNQQCKVTIEIRKVVWDDDKGDWVKAPLSNKELESLTIRPWSDQLRPPQAPNWDCDTVPNDFTQGLRTAGRASLTVGPSQVETSAVDAVDAPRSNEAPQIEFRYMKTTRAQPQQFMACITLDDGKQYTTYQGGSSTFNSRIEIQPQNPYVIRVSDLRATRSDAYTKEYEKGNWIDIDVYYWDLPGGLRIYRESFSGQGSQRSKVVHAYVINLPKRLNLGAAIKTGVTSLTLGDIAGHASTGVSDSTPVPLSGDGVTVLRALREFIDYRSLNPAHNDQLRWTITDNYGCQSTFILRANPGDQGNTLELSNG